LLTFSRQKIVNPQVIDLNRVVLDLEPMLRRLIGEDLHLEVVPDRRPAVVKADPGQMGQVIMNLVVNARDAMPQGGRLTLKTAPVNFTVGCHSKFGLTPPGPYVMLGVEDTGVGMDEATQAHIFGPYHLNRARHWTGAVLGMGSSGKAAVIWTWPASPGPAAPSPSICPAWRRSLNHPGRRFPSPRASRGRRRFC
jgi:C4-dicarboxylate-specific signal transduction histidine kinase